MSRRSRNLTSGVVVNSGQEASLCAGLRHLSQDTCGPKGGRFEDLRDHVEGRYVYVSIPLRVGMVKLSVN